MSSNFSDIGDFHEKFGVHFVGLDDGQGPQEMTLELIMFRVKFLIEELTELVIALGGKLDWSLDFENFDPENIDHVEAFDALIDLAVVTFGTAHVFGYPWQNGWDTVHRANMKKVRAAADGSDSKRGSGLDIVKPEGWTAPDHRPTLLDAGFSV
jgi:predicted HAD superfamily Cof-like phosphohydrolase